MITFINLNRWKYDASRGLHENCKTPQLSDAELVHYLVKKANDAASLVPQALTVVPAKKRGPAQVDKTSSNTALKSKTIVKKPLTKSGFQKKRKHEEVVIVSDTEDEIALKKKR